MEIAVFGGAFDPPHLGHQAIANYLIDSGKADKVWFLPVKIHHFGKHVAAAEHRLAMLETIVQERPDSFQIQTYELDKPLKSYNKTYLTLTHFRQQYPADHFSFVIGADNLARFSEWDFYQELVNEFPFWVYPRSGFKFEPLMPGMIPLTEAPLVTTSSTEIRQAASQHQPLAGLVAPSIEQYIKAHNLYAA